MRALLIAFEDWYSTARLPATLSNAGFDVAVLCEPGLLVAQSTYAVRRFALDVPQIRRGRLQSIVSAIDAFSPDLIIPADERSLRVTSALRTHALAALRPDLGLLIQRSIGNREASKDVGNRLRMLDIVGGLGCPTPSHVGGRRLRDILSFAKQHGWPIYLKLDHTYGGSGVRLCADAAAARTVHAQFISGYSLSTPRGLWGRGRRLLRLARGIRDPMAIPIGVGSISVETAVIGEPAYYTGVALEGRRLAGFAAEVEEFHPRPSGPSARVRLHHDATMDNLAERLVALLGYSGFFGLDFIRKPDSTLVFLEFNGRISTLCHLGALVGADLGAALFAAMAGRAAVKSDRTAPVRVALFPQDWIRDPHANRQGLYLDVPLNDPSLTAALIRRLPSTVDKAEIAMLSQPPSFRG